MFISWLNRADASMDWLKSAVEIICKNCKLQPGRMQIGAGRDRTFPLLRRRQMGSFALPQLTG